MIANTKNIFVYGTLKKGQSNHFYLDDYGSQFLGEGTLYNHKITEVPGVNFPFILDESCPGCKVEGEIYAVDPEILNKIDKLEGHPIFYNRQQKKVELRYGKQIVVCECEVYLFPVSLFKTRYTNHCQDGRGLVREL